MSEEQQAAVEETQQETTQSEPSAWKATLNQWQGSEVENAAGIESAEGSAETAAAETQTTTQEPAKQEKPAAYSASFAALARREKAFAANRAAFKAEQSKWESDRKAIEDFRSKIKADPVSAFEDLANQAGVQFHEVFREAARRLAQSDPSTEDIAKAEARAAVEAYKKEQEELSNKNAREHIQGQVQTALSTFASMVKEDTYPLLSTEDPEKVASVALEYAQNRYQDSGGKEALAYEQVLGILESRLQEDFDRKKAIREAREAKAKSQAALPTAQSGIGQSGNQGQQKPRTLTQKHVGEAGTPSKTSWQARLDRFLDGAGDP